MANEQIFPDSRASWHVRVTDANANRDGSGTLVAFKGAQPLPHGLQVTNIRVLSEDATPAETYRVFARQPEMGAAYLIWELAVTANMTDDPQDDLYIPAGTYLSATSNGGEDADIYIIGDEYRSDVRP